MSLLSRHRFHTRRTRTHRPEQMRPLSSGRRCPTPELGYTLEHLCCLIAWERTSASRSLARRPATTSSSASRRSRPRASASWTPPLRPLHRPHRPSPCRANHPRSHRRCRRSSEAATEAAVVVAVALTAAAPSPRRSVRTHSSSVRTSVCTAFRVAVATRAASEALETAPRMPGPNRARRCGMNMSSTKTCPRF